MRKIRAILVLLAVLGTQQIFAEGDINVSGEDAADKPCATIVKSCMDAGYTREDSGDKKLWKNCLKPIILGKAVSGVNVDDSVVKSCRIHKIKKMKTELKEFQEAH
jgi:hypothetical protein